MTEDLVLGAGMEEILVRSADEAARIATFDGGLGHISLLNISPYPWLSGPAVVIPAEPDSVPLATRTRCWWSC